MVAQQQVKCIGGFVFVQVSEVDAMSDFAGLIEPMTPFVFIPRAAKFAVCGLQLANGPVIGEEKESNRERRRRQIKCQRSLAIQPEHDEKEGHQK